MDLGADDYISKPFGTSELLARIRTALRHSAKNSGGAVNNDVFSTKGLTIDFDKRKITVDGKDVHLTQIEFKIVSLLAKSAGRVLTYDYIITELWGPYAVKDNQILRVNMANIRRKLEKNPASPEYIFTEVRHRLPHGRYPLIYLSEFTNEYKKPWLIFQNQGFFVFSFLIICGLLRTCVQSGQQPYWSNPIRYRTKQSVLQSYHPE